MYPVPDILYCSIVGNTCMCCTAVLLNVAVLACGRVDESRHLGNECPSRLVRQAKRITSTITLYISTAVACLVLLAAAAAASSVINPV